MHWFLFGAAVLLAVVFAIARYCYRLTFYNRNDVQEDPVTVPPGEQYQALAEPMLANIRELNVLPYESVYITSQDGLRLFGRYYHIRDGAPVQIQFHGYRGNAIREYSGGHKMAREIGYNALVVDQRAHGKSEGHTITFGILERYDCMEWVRYVSNRFGADTPIILSGVSMGAATVLMASELELPGNVVAITADCPYSSPGAIIRRVCRDIHIPGWLAYPFIVLAAWVYGGFRIWETSAVKAVANTAIPIHIIHGEDDRFVPCDMSREIYKACAGVRRLVTIPEAGHGLCYLVDTPKYEQAFRSFLNACGIGKDA